MSAALVELTEYQERSGLRLSTGQVAALTSAGLVSLRGDVDGTWHLAADRGVVGAVRLGRGADAVELRIAPKLPIRRLLFLIGYAQHGVEWHHRQVAGAERTGLLPALAHVFGRMAERALARGVLRGYRTVEEALPVVRGRIRESEQSRHRFGALFPVEVRYDDHSPDIPENQVLLAAGRRLLRIPGLDAPTRALLHRVLRRLADVTPPVAGRPLPRWRPSRLNAHYQAPLALAELVLRGGSYELDDGRTVRVDGLVLRMWQVFEDFTARAVGDALSAHGGRCEPQDRTHHLDRARTVRLRPDLVYYRGGPDGRERPHAVVDAKYTWGRHGHNDDLYQVLAYCTALGLRDGHLVYAAGRDADYRAHRLTGPGGITIHQHTLDLDQPPEQVLGQVRSIASRIRDTAL